MSTNTSLPQCAVCRVLYRAVCPGARPSKADDYICTGMRVRDLAPAKLWATKFEAIAAGNRAHHMIISRCKVSSDWSMRGHVTRGSPLIGCRSR